MLFQQSQSRFNEVFDFALIDFFRIIERGAPFVPDSRASTLATGNPSTSGFSDGLSKKRNRT
jgi:hypothetical protein